jgi:tmRNA-binding protein
MNYLIPIVAVIVVIVIVVVYLAAALSKVEWDMGSGRKKHEKFDSPKRK